MTWSKCKSSTSKKNKIRCQKIENKKLKIIIYTIYFKIIFVKKKYLII